VDGTGPLRVIQSVAQKIRLECLLLMVHHTHARTHIISWYYDVQNAQGHAFLSYYTDYLHSDAADIGTPDCLCLASASSRHQTLVWARETQ
jgi:hypothetical protein